jgi:hypothetical protein
MPRTAVAAVLLSALAAACAGGGYYRLPLTPGADGSVSSDVTVAYFSLGKPPRGASHAYREFDPEVDDEVVFVFAMRYPRQPFTLRGVLRRPDGTEHAAFSRTGQAYQPGTFVEYTTHEVFAMSSLRPFIGRWTLRVTHDGAPLGVYEFILADRAHIAEFRRPR